MGTSTSQAAAAALLLALAAAPALAGTAAGVPETGSYLIQADVVQVSPRYGWREVSEPVRQCVSVADPYRSGYHGQHRQVRHYRHGYGRDDGYRRRDGSDAAAGLVGGLIGGLIGNQFGGGNGKTALTVAGAVLGASIAGDHVRRSRAYAGPSYDYAPVRRTTQRCTETRQIRRVRGVDGYDVSYRYQGRTFNKWMNEHPGDTVSVRVAVEPLDEFQP